MLHWWDDTKFSEACQFSLPLNYSFPSLCFFPYLFLLLSLSIFNRLHIAHYFLFFNIWGCLERQSYRRRKIHSIGSEPAGGTSKSAMDHAERQLNCVEIQRPAPLPICPFLDSLAKVPNPFQWGLRGEDTQKPRKRSSPEYHQNTHNNVLMPSAKLHPTPLQQRDVSWRWLLCVCTQMLLKITANRG